jgi:hypothetical protein
VDRSVILHSRFLTRISVIQRQMSEALNKRAKEMLEKANWAMSQPSELTPEEERRFQKWLKEDDSPAKPRPRK